MRAALWRTAFALSLVFAFVVAGSILGLAYYLIFTPSEQQAFWAVPLLAFHILVVVPAFFVSYLLAVMADAR